MYDEMKKEVKVSEHEYRYIGKHGTRADAADIVSGRQQYLDDLNIPNMLVVRVLAVSELYHPQDRRQPRQSAGRRGRRSHLRKCAGLEMRPAESPPCAGSTYALYRRQRGTCRSPQHRNCG